MKIDRIKWMKIAEKIFLIDNINIIPAKIKFEIQ